MFLDKEVNIEKLKKSIEILEKDEYSNIQFELSYDINDINSKYPGFKEKTSQSSYKFSFLCGLWKKDKLLDIIKTDDNPWNIEYEQKYDSSKHKFMQVSDEKIISWFNDGYGGNGVIKMGQWKHCVEDFFKKEQIEVDFSKKGFLEE